MVSAPSPPRMASLLFPPSNWAAPQPALPRPTMSLEQYWESNKIYLKTPRTAIEHPLALWVARQCEGLAAALRHLQHGRVATSPNGIPTFGDDLAVRALHANIRPANILAVFGPGEALPVLQLAGLEPAAGEAFCDDDASASTTAAGRDYIAPEVFSGDTVRWDGASRSSSGKADVWSLGCVFLDFVEWLMPTTSSERVPRRRLTDRDETLAPFVEGREAWRDWRRSRVGAGDEGVVAFYFDAYSGELSEWIYTVSDEIFPGHA